MPALYILTGSNGAGKSTTGRFYLPDHVKDYYEIFDGDKLFMQKRMQFYKKETPSLKEASRLATEWLYEEFERQVATAINNSNDFVYEGHFPEEENWATPKRFKSAGYRIHVIFMGLLHPGTSEQRVLHRAKRGGHNVPVYEIERNFYGNLQQLNKNDGLIDELKIIDTSGSRKPKILAVISDRRITDAMPVKDMPDWFVKGLPNLYKKISDWEGTFNR